MLTAITNIKVLWQVEDDLQRKTTFGGRRPLVEDDLWWKTPLVEDGLQWKTTFGGRRPMVENDLQWKTNFVDPCMLPTPLCGIFYSVALVQTSDLQPKDQGEQLHLHFN